MFRYKNTNKKALIFAALIILVCLACLSGATFALFTSTNDGTIGVVTTSGNVEIDIVDTSGKSLKGESLQFVTFSDDYLFEPGATFYTQGFEVKNAGNIPVNFTLSVSKDEKIDMKEFDEAFEVWIVRVDDENFSDAERITNFKGRLEVGENSETYCLFIKMKETAGNEFQNKTYTGIGVTVYAVQGNAPIN